ADHEPHGEGDQQRDERQRLAAVAGPWTRWTWTHGPSRGTQGREGGSAGTTACRDRVGGRLVVTTVEDGGHRGHLLVVVEGHDPHAHGVAAEGLVPDVAHPHADDHAVRRHQHHLGVVA